MKHLDNFFSNNTETPIINNSYGKTKEEERPILKTFVKATNIALIAIISMNIMSALNPAKADIYNYKDSLASYEYILEKEQNTSGKDIFYAKFDGNGYMKISEDNIDYVIKNKDGKYETVSFEEFSQKSDFLNQDINNDNIKEFIDSFKDKNNLDKDQRIKNGIEVLDLFETNKDYYKFNKYNEHFDYEQVANSKKSIELFNSIEKAFNEKSNIDLANNQDFQKLKDIELERIYNDIEYDIIEDSIVINNFSKYNFEYSNDLLSKVFDSKETKELKSENQLNILYQNFYLSSKYSIENKINDKELSNLVEKTKQDIIEFNNGQPIKYDKGSPFLLTSNHEFSLRALNDTINPIKFSNTIYKVKNPSLENNDKYIDSSASVLVKKSSGITLEFFQNNLNKIYDKDGNITHVSKYIWEKSNTQEEDNNLREELGYLN